MACSKYKCEYQYRQPKNGFLLCKNIMDEDVDYNIKENALKSLCAFQKYCPRTQKMENSDGAKYCNIKHKNNTTVEPTDE